MNQSVQVNRLKQWGKCPIANDNEQTRKLLPRNDHGRDKNYAFHRPRAHPVEHFLPWAVELSKTCIKVRVASGHRVRRATGEGAALGMAEHCTAQLNDGRGNPADASAGRYYRSLGTVRPLDEACDWSYLQGYSFGGGPHTDTTRWALSSLLLPSVKNRGEWQCFQPFASLKASPSLTGRTEGPL